MIRYYLKKRFDLLKNFACIFLGVSIVLPLRYAVCTLIVFFVLDYLSIKIERSAAQTSGARSDRPSATPPN